MADLEAQIKEWWNRRQELSPGDPDAVMAARAAVDLLDRGEARVAELGPDGSVVVHEWCKQAILLLFQLLAVETLEAGPFEYADKLPLKRSFAAAGVRVVPGASARWGSYLEPGVILMPSYVNIGARVGTSHDGRHLGHGGQLCADRPEHPPVGRCGHRRGPGAAASGARYSSATSA